MKMLILFLIFRLLQAISSSAYSNEINLIVNIVKSYEIPTTLSALLCCNPREKIILTVMLGNSKNPTTIKFLNGQSFESKSVPKETLFVTDLSCHDANNILKHANETNTFRSPYRWLLITDANNGTIIPHLVYAMNLNILLNSEVIVATKQAEENFELHYIYKLRANNFWITEYFGSWNSSTGLQKSDLDQTGTRVLRRRNLAGEHLRVGFNVDDKETGLRSTEHDYKVRYSFNSPTMFGYLIVLPLCEFLNATRINHFSDSWGYYVNGSWGGLVGAMARGDIELSGAPIFIVKERMKYIKYMMGSTLRSSVKFVFRGPPLSYQNNLFLLPFHTAVWYSLAGFVLLIVFVLYVIAQWEMKNIDIKSDNDELDANRQAELKKNITISDVAMVIVGAISQQGSLVQFRGSIGRLVTFILFLVFLFLFTAYSANIVALLQSTSKQIRTLSDLLNSKLELGVENMSYNIHYFKTANDPVRKAIYETKVAPKGSKPKFMSIEEGVINMQKKPFAFHMDVGIGYGVIEKYFYEHEKCALQEIAFIPTTKPWMSCRKESPYDELFKIGLYRILEHGINERVNNIVYSKKPVCSVGGGNFDSVSIVDVYPPLLMLLYGKLLACAVLLLEVTVHRLTKRRLDHEEAGDVSTDNNVTTYIH